MAKHSTGEASKSMHSSCLSKKQNQGWPRIWCPAFDICTTAGFLVICFLVKSFIWSCIRFQWERCRAPLNLIPTPSQTHPHLQQSQVNPTHSAVSFHRVTTHLWNLRQKEEEANYGTVSTATAFKRVRQKENERKRERERDWVRERESARARERLFPGGEFEFASRKHINCGLPGVKTQL